MAVKQKVLECVQQTPESRLQNILCTLQHITTQGLQSKVCAEIVMSLGMIQVPSDPTKYLKFVEDVKHVKDSLEKECLKYKLVSVTLKELYNEISTSDKILSPAMSIVLQLIEIHQIPNAVDLILQTGYSLEGQKRALLTLCTWLSKWTYTDNLGPLVFTFIQGLEAQHQYDILYDVTMATIEPMFRVLVLSDYRKNVGPVVLYLLSQSQNNPDAFHKIMPHISTVVDLLYKQKTETSLLYLREIVNVCVRLMDEFPEHSKMYQEVRSILQPYLPSDDLKNPINDSTILDSNMQLTTMYSNIGKVGLNNLGNTCYMNSVLQALFMTKPFRNSILLNKEITLLLVKLQSLFALLQYSKRSSLSPNDISNFARPPGFLPGQQHDSSEFLGYLLDVLHEQEKNSFVQNDAGTSDGATNSFHGTIVQTTFGGRTLSVSHCSQCGMKSERADNFRDLQLSIPNNSDSQSVQTLLDYYLMPEKLSGDNQYYCDVCDGLTDGERVTCIAEAPRHLILTLKNFRYDPQSQQKTKLLQSVTLDKNIRLGHDGHEYELYAAVVHCGSSVDSGHYYTFAKDGGGMDSCDGDDWYKFNDCFVARTMSEELCALKSPETPYILFYRRVDCLNPDTLTRTLLSLRLQTLINKDQMEFEAEKRRRPLKPTLYTNNRQNGSDEQPPPGCGGSGFSNNSSNMYVC